MELVVLKFFKDPDSDSKLKTTNLDDGLSNILFNNLRELSEEQRVTRVTRFSTRQFNCLLIPMKLT